MNETRRRQFLVAAGTLVAAPLVWAQAPERTRKIGLILVLARKGLEDLVQAFEGGMREHGWVNGKNLAIEYRFADGRLDRIPALATELQKLDVELIVTGTNPATVAARDATSGIPIVAAIATDVISKGLAVSLARPGGRITGVTWDVGADLYAKRLELLKEAAPSVSRVAILFDPIYEGSPDAVRGGIERAAGVLRVSLAWPEVSDDVDAMFTAILRDRANAVYLVGGARTYGLRARLAESALKHRLPMICHASQQVDAGGLMSFSPSALSSYRDAARYVDKILKGTKPGELPIEQPTRFELVVNLRTAKALGITIPPSILLRADRVIE